MAQDEPTHRQDRPRGPRRDPGAPGRRDAPIGVFDSGLGGLTVVRELYEAMPAERIVYLGDSARVPYGTKSLETVRRFAMEDAAFLMRFGPKMIVVACNTASAAAISQLEASCPVEVVDVIRPSAAAAVARTDGPLGVIATEATIASGAYQRAIAALDPHRDVMAVACPLLVPIVEEGRSEDDPIVAHVLCDYLRELQRRLPTVRKPAGSPGALILGCTHYPLLARAIGKLMGPNVVLVNSGRAAALEVQRRLCQTDLAAAPQEATTAGSASGGRGRLECYTTDNPGRFARLAERFGGRPVDQVLYVGTDELESPLTGSRRTSGPRPGGQ